MKFVHLISFCLSFSLIFGSIFVHCNPIIVQGLPNNPLDSTSNTVSQTTLTIALDTLNYAEVDLKGGELLTNQTLPVCNLSQVALSDDQWRCDCHFKWLKSSKKDDPIHIIRVSQLLDSSDKLAECHFNPIGIQSSCDLSVLVDPKTDSNYEAFANDDLQTKGDRCQDPISIDTIDGVIYRLGDVQDVSIKRMGSGIVYINSLRNGNINIQNFDSGIINIGTVVNGNVRIGLFNSGILNVDTITNGDVKVIAYESGLINTGTMNNVNFMIESPAVCDQTYKMDAHNTTWTLHTPKLYSDI